MTLPAHRFEERKKKHKGKVIVFDFDGTITGAPAFVSRIAKGLKQQGDTIVVLTGNVMARKDLLDTLDDFGFPYDEVVQYHDDDSNGVSRAEYLKRFNAWGAFDNRIDRAVIFAPICPHLYLVVEPSKDDEQAAQKADAKQDAKKTAKDIGVRSAGPERPPNYRLATVLGRNCKTCKYDDNGFCTKYEVNVDPQHVCDKWQPDE